MISKEELKNALIGKRKLHDHDGHKASGLHGDANLIYFMHDLLEKNKFFIETGTYIGGTLRYLAENHTDVEFKSCELISQVFYYALRNCSHLNNTEIFNLTSTKFINSIVNDIKSNKFKFDGIPVFWLDAHGENIDEAPVKEEIKYIVDNLKDYIILVDDTYNPNYPKQFSQLSINYFDTFLDDYNAIWPTYESTYLYQDDKLILAKPEGSAGFSSWCCITNIEEIKNHMIFKEGTND